MQYTNFSQLGQTLGSGLAPQGGASASGVSKAGGYGALVGAVIDLGFTIHNARQARKTLKAQHDAIRQRNTNVLNEMMRSIAVVQQDRALAMMRIQEAKWATQAKTTTFRSELELNQAASGMAGQTFDILKADITRQRDESITRLDFNAEVIGQQYDNQTHALINQAQNATQNPALSVQNFDLSSALGALSNTLEPTIQAYSNYQGRRSRTGGSGIALNSQWINQSTQKSAGLAYNLGLY